MRASTLVLVSAGDWYNHTRAPDTYSIRIPIFATAWLVVAVGIASALHLRFYRPSLRHVLPLVDGLFLAIALFNLWGSLGTEHFHHIGALTTAALACALFSSTGALRLTRVSAGLTAAMAIPIYVFIATVASGWREMTSITSRRSSASACSACG